MSIFRRIRQLVSISALLWLGSLGCAASHHPTVPSELGRAGTSHEMMAVIPELGPVEFESVITALQRVSDDPAQGQRQLTVATPIFERHRLAALGAE